MDFTSMLPQYPGGSKLLLPSQMMNWANELSEMMVELDYKEEAANYFKSLGVNLEFFLNQDYGAMVVSFLDLEDNRPLFLAQYLGQDAEIIRVFPFLGFEEEH